MFVFCKKPFSLNNFYLLSCTVQFNSIKYTNAYNGKQRNEILTISMLTKACTPDGTEVLSFHSFSEHCKHLK